MSRDALRASAASELERWERLLADEMLRLFDRQEAVVLARLQGTKARKHTRHWEPPGERKIDASYVLDPARWVKDASGSTAPLVSRMYAETYDATATDLAALPAPDPTTPPPVETPPAAADQPPPPPPEADSAVPPAAAAAVMAAVLAPDAPASDGSVLPWLVTFAVLIHTLRSNRSSNIDGAVQRQLGVIADMARGIGEGVQQVIAQAEDAGTPMPGIVDAVRGLYAKQRAAWAARIAQAVVAPAVNEAKILSAGDVAQALTATAAAGGAPPALTKEWLSSHDDRVRPTHAHADGQVVGLGELFRLGGIPLHPVVSFCRYPGEATLPPDERCNCRCTMIFARVLGIKTGGPIDTKALPKTETCSEKGCSEQATKRVIWAEGMAYQPCCDAHLAATKHRLEVGQNYGPVDAVRDIKTDAELEAKEDRVRTVAGERRFGEAIGSVIHRNPSIPFSSAPAKRKVFGQIAGLDVTLGGSDPEVRKLIAEHSAPNSPPDPASTEVLVLRDHRDRIAGYTVWQIKDGPQPAGTIVAVSVHPSLRGKHIGDQMVRFVAQADPAVKPQTRPSSPSSTPAGAPKVRPQRAVDANGLPVIDDRAAAGDAPGTSGDFDADAKRIDRLQKAYLRDKVDTASLFSRGGRWSRDRERQQQEIIDHFLTQPGVKADRKILVIGGLPGAGKTTSINSPAGQQALGIDLGDYVTVNADEVKAEMVARGMVPDYPGLSADEAATLYHAESFEVAHSLMRQAAKRGLNFAYDTSLKSSGQLSFATSAGDRTKPPPWDTTLLFVDVPPQVAKQRAKDRYLAGGRYMPLALISGMGDAPARNFDSIKGSVDRYVEMDNSGAAPVVIDTGGRRRRTAAAAVPTPAAARSNAQMPPSPRPAAAPAPVGASALPPAPTGALVYSHPQGKTIYVLPDGSMEVYKPDGKRASSSATPAKLAAGYGGWSLVAAAPSAPAPAPKAHVPDAPALVTPSTDPLDELPSAPAPAGSMPVVPMDFNEVPTLADVPKFIADPDYVFQQKVDGIRGVLVIDAGKKPWFASKKGQRLQSSTAAKTTDPMLKVLPATPADAPSYRVEGEILNGKFHVFDMVVVGSEALPYEKRKQMADAWVESVKPALPQVEALPTATTAKEKQALWDQVVASGAEGVMMKRKDSPYNGGTRVNHTLKAKITATADVVVLAKGIGGKDNAQIGLRVGGQVTPIGTVSTLGKGPLDVGDVVEVEYLWATPDNTLAQPRIVRRRPDKTPNDVTDASQLRQVDKTVLALAQKRLDFLLEQQRVEVEV